MFEFKNWWEEKKNKIGWIEFLEIGRSVVMCMCVSDLCDIVLEFDVWELNVVIKFSYVKRIF